MSFSPQACTVSSVILLLEGTESIKIQRFFNSMTFAKKLRGNQSRVSNVIGARGLRKHIHMCK
jgi:hypothetical protein